MSLLVLGRSLSLTSKASTGPPIFWADDEFSDKETWAATRGATPINTPEWEDKEGGKNEFKEYNVVWDLHCECSSSLLGFRGSPC